MAIDEAGHVRQIKRGVIIIILHDEDILTPHPVQSCEEIHPERVLAELDILLRNLTAGSNLFNGSGRRPPNIICATRKVVRIIWHVPIINDDPLIGLNSLRRHPSIAKQSESERPIPRRGNDSNSAAGH
jgi:hypothetical protein